MFLLPRYLRVAVAWALMPAAVWSGVQAPECECSTGEHRFFCPHMLFGLKNPAKSDETVATKHSCCHRAAAEADRSKDVAPSASGLHRALTNPCSRCKPVPSSTPTVTVRVDVPAHHDLAWLPATHLVDRASLVVMSANERALPASDRLPMTDRVINFCCLLI